jgi:hypothetical protein
MWGIIISNVAGAFFTYFVMPLFSRFLVWLEEQRNERREDEELKTEIRKKVEEYKNAKTAEEQEAAFRELHRLRKL